MTTAPQRTVTLTDDLTGKSWKLPVFDGSMGPSVIDIRKLYTDTGYFTHDPGFTSTSSCESKITFIDGDKGILLHRGYPIDQLAEKSDFLEVAYLLQFGELPEILDIALAGIAGEIEGDAAARGAGRLAAPAALRTRRSRRW